MTLKDALKHVVMLNGKEELKSHRLINLLSDYNAFYDYPSTKYILKGVIDAGFINLLTQSTIEKDEVENIIRDLYEKYGFRRDISVNVINAISFALNRADLLLIEEPIECSEIAEATHAAKEDHVVFSGVSLGLPIAKIAQHLTKRGFLVREVKPYQVSMDGTFCGEDKVELYINGSPFGLTKSIVLRFDSYIGSLLDNTTKFYTLLTQKYGKPVEFRDNLKCLGKDIEHYTKNVTKFLRAKENYDEVFYSKWNVKGGCIEIDWWAESFRLCYQDTYNTKYAEDHQQEFDMSSI